MKTFKEFLESEDYRGEHQAPDADGGAPMHDLTHNGIYPHDVYSHKGFDYYHNHGNDYDHGTHSRIVSCQGNPDKMISVHRAVPTDVYKKAMKTDSPMSTIIHKGAWVTPTKEYAREHGESALNGDYKIMSKRVPAKHLYTDGNSPHEWGYHPE